MAEWARLLFRKSRVLLAMVLAAPLVLVVRALRPWVIIRFGRLKSDRFGHFALNTAIYLCERDAGLYDRRVVDIFYHTASISNEQLKTMWDRTLRVWQFAAVVDRVNQLVPGSDLHAAPLPSRDMHGVLARKTVHLSFTDEEEQRGQAALRSFGIPYGARFICFHARDDAYQNVNYPHKDFGPPYRDSTIQDRLPAAEELTRRGYFAIRMGAIVKDPLKTANPMVIDYATSARTEFLDIFLCAKCDFFLGDSAGIFTTAMIFGRPVALVNFMPLEYAPTWRPDDLFIPKKLWLRHERRFMTWREVLDLRVRSLTYPYYRYGIDIVDNTPDEITALAVEMDERMRGTWKAVDEDEDLQRRFWSLWTPSDLNRVFQARMGAEFLRAHRELLK